MPNIDGVEVSGCDECIGVLNNFETAQSSISVLGKVVIPDQLSSYYPPIRSGVEGDFAHAKLRMGWKLNRVGDDCPVKVAGGVCDLAGVVHENLTSEEKASTGLIPFPQSQGFESPDVSTP